MSCLTHLYRVILSEMLLAIRTATTSPYIAMIPAMTTGMMDFMISSGRITDMAAIPVPLFAVPYAAPNAAHKHTHPAYSSCTVFIITATKILKHYYLTFQ